MNAREVFESLFSVDEPFWQFRDWDPEQSELTLTMLWVNRSALEKLRKAVPYGSFFISPEMMDGRVYLEVCLSGVTLPEKAPGLGRSLEAEKAIAAAKTLCLDAKSVSLREIAEVSGELHRTLDEEDPFWTGWRRFLASRGLGPASA